MWISSTATPAASGGWAVRRRREKDEHRPQPLAASGERVPPTAATVPGGSDRRLETLLELVEVGLEAGDLPDGGERGHLACR